MTAELIPLATMTLEVRPPVVFDPTPAGGRWIVEAEAGRIEGDRIQAGIKGNANADWFVVGPGQVGTVDARLLAETTDGALVLLQYNGRVDLSAGPGPIYIAPRFDTADERYDWLNKLQAVGKGAFVDRSTLVYELYEVR
jgi:hypothetical protein